MKKTAVFLALLLTLGITGCGAQKDTGSDSAEETTKEAQGETQEGTDALTVDEASKTITVQATATGNTESSIHLLVNESGSNAKSAFFTTEASTMDFYDALVELGGIPGNNIPVDAESGTILGSGLDVSITVDGTEYDTYDLITASEEREMDMRFGGNVALNQEYATGCLLCMESCSVGIASDAAYQYNEPIEFTPSDSMPEEGTDVTFTIKVDDTSMVVNEEAKTISMNILSTGYDKSTIHAIVNEEGSNADKTLFTTTADTKEFYEALKQLGAQDGNNIALDDPDGIIEGTGLDVNVEIGTENCSFADLFTASEERDMDMRFGGNLEVNQEYATGCIMCLESCPAGITSNAAYQYQEEITFGPSDKMPAKGTHIIATFTVEE
ncbi:MULTISPECIES: YdjY domain-containing protein [Clostridia]|uniref:4Fe-4S ferredoxin-type domain-containing protein n=1 Tax=Faecalicatena fissicatena TaxID=290055 RepID=A0ABS2E6Y5_9FIRM|nr:MULTISPECIES: YdjY domain-containing protein [Clostridia]MBM6737369.1 hypothetical protein [Faecalicatena fissicatena]HIX98666.1 hypothetical protein [Candidatus Dorea intestinigallinarum]